MSKLNYSKKIQKQLDSVCAVIEHWEYRTLPAVRFIEIEWNYGKDDWAKKREKAASVLDTMPEYVSGFDYDLTFSHHFGKTVDEERNHDYIGRDRKSVV